MKILKKIGKTSLLIHTNTRNKMKKLRSILKLCIKILRKLKGCTTICLRTIIRTRNKNNTKKIRIFSKCKLRMWEYNMKRKKRKKKHKVKVDKISMDEKNKKVPNLK